MPGIEINQKQNVISAVFPQVCLIWIKSRQEPDANLYWMTPTPRPPVRHCPLCGVAMQAKKSREDLPYFDTFNCLACQTTIVEAQTRPPSRPR